MSERTSGTAGREELDESVAPPAHRGDAGSLAGCLIVGAAIFLPALLYFGLFAFILLDELVLQTDWLLGNLPDPAIEFLRLIYTPLIWLMDQFDG
jgi:hypothetical protein